MCELKSEMKEVDNSLKLVTPSRVCELKFGQGSELYDSFYCHTLTGVWVEIARSVTTKSTLGHTLTGVWVEISIDSK